MKHLAILFATAGLALAAVFAPAPAHARAYTWCTAGPFGSKLWPDGQRTFNNEWNSTLPQQMCANSPADVRVISQQTVTATANCPAALTYPAVQHDFPGSGTAVSSLTRVRSVYTETQPGYPAAIGEFTSDDWLTTPGGPFEKYEVMVWQDNQGQAPAGSLVGTAKLGAARYKVYHGGGYNAFVRVGNSASGTIRHLAAWRWLINHGYMASNAVVEQEEIGWEICTDPPGGGTYRITRNTLTIK